MSGPTDPSLPLRKAKHEAFCQLMAPGTISYDEAFAQVGYKRDSANAYRLRIRPDVEARIAFLQQRSIDKATNVMAAGMAQTMADRAWVTDKLIRLAREALGELPVKVRRKVKGKEVVEEQFVRHENAALRALSLLGQDLGMFQADAPAPPQTDVDAARSAADPRIIESLKRYASGKPKLITLDGAAIKTVD